MIELMNYRMKVTALALASVVISSASMAQTAMFKPKPGIKEFTGELLVKPATAKTILSRGWNLSKSQFAMRNARKRISRNVRSYISGLDVYVVRVPRGSSENRYALELLRTGEYETVEPNWRVFTLGAPSDPRFGEQWHHAAIQSAAAWDISTGTGSIITGYVDTGIMTTHEDLAANRLPGFNSVDMKLEVDGGSMIDENGHGTHVAGDGSAIGNNGKGVSGAAWNHKILFAKCSNGPGGSTGLNFILEGAKWCLDNGAKTVGVSWGGCDTTLARDMGEYATSKGAMLFWAAGNSREDWSGFEWTDTMVVGGTKIGDQLYDGTATGLGVSFMAPAVDILSTTNDGKYQNFTGTSMATPLASGVVALAWEQNPDITPAEMRDLISQSCDFVGPENLVGWGRINSLKLLTNVGTTDPIELDIDNVSTGTGSYDRGNLDSVNDDDLTNSYVVSSSQVSNVGSVASSALGIVLPTDKTLTSVEITLQVKTTTNRPTSVVLYGLNRITGNFDQLKATGTFGNSEMEIRARMRQSVLGDYINADGSGSFLVRSVVPARLGGTPTKLEIGHAKVRITQKNN